MTQHDETTIYFRRSNTNTCKHNTQCNDITTSGQSNLSKRLHHHHAWMVQSYSPSGANVQPHSTCFLVPTQIHIPNSISIGSAVFTPQSL